VKNILVTGGTVFAGRRIAEYFTAIYENIFVLNRGPPRGAFERN
jgi:nucleoside-diphosphate-sugar epimerase